MSWDWAIDAGKGLIALTLAWFANYLRKQAKPIVQAVKKIGNIVRIINTLEAKQSILASEMLAFYHVSKHPIYIIDKTGAVTYVNPAWVAMAGFRDDKDAHGYGYMRAVHPEDREEMEQQRLLMEKKQSSGNGTVRFKNIQTGVVVNMEYVSELVYNDKGEVVKIIGTLYIVA